MTLLGVGDAAPKPICGCCEGVLAAPPPNSDGAGEGELGIAVFAPKSDGLAEGVENAIVLSSSSSIGKAELCEVYNDD